MIGVFDSGAGGLTVVKELQQLLPQNDILYFADNARYPYGNQSRERLIQYAREDAALLIKHGATIIVIACNSASAAAASVLRQELSLPVFDMITSVVDIIQALPPKTRLGVIGTKATITSGAYEQLLSPRSLTAIATPMLVPLVEERWWQHSESKRMIRRSLSPLKKARLQALILGCTHFPIIKSLIGEIMGKKVRLINPAETIANSVAKHITENPNLAAKNKTPSKLTILASSEAEQFSDTATKWFGHKVKVNLAQPL